MRIVLVVAFQVSDDTGDGSNSIGFFRLLAQYRLWRIQRNILLL